MLRVGVADLRADEFMYEQRQYVWQSVSALGGVKEAWVIAVIVRIGGKSNPGQMQLYANICCAVTICC